jgi:1-acyl-sn-glycerol-3-phosphate acyltransferase
MIYTIYTYTYAGKLQPFKKGGFVLAIQAGIPVVPLCVCGTYDVVVKGFFFLSFLAGACEASRHYQAHGS